MRRLILLVAFLTVLLPGPIGILVAQSSAPAQTEDHKSEIVYITKTGKKYHRAGCRYLSHSQIKTTVGEAQAQGYTPCLICQPPQ